MPGIDVAIFSSVMMYPFSSVFRGTRVIPELGTNPTKKQIETHKILYEGTNPKQANFIQRRYNSGKDKFDDKRASIYAGVDDTDRIVLHKN
jgi:hypothetical protein